MHPPRQRLLRENRCRPCRCCRRPSRACRGRLQQSARTAARRRAKGTGRVARGPCCQCPRCPPRQAAWRGQGAMRRQPQVWARPRTRRMQRLRRGAAFGCCQLQGRPERHAKQHWQSGLQNATQRGCSGCRRCLSQAWGRSPRPPRPRVEGKGRREARRECSAPGRAKLRAQQGRRYHACTLNALGE